MRETEVLLLLFLRVHIHTTRRYGGLGLYVLSLGTDPQDDRAASTRKGGSLRAPSGLCVYMEELWNCWGERGIWLRMRSSGSEAK